MRVLFVGTDTATKETVTLSARSYSSGAQVLASARAASGVQVVDGERPDLVFMSTDFTDLSLVQAVREIRRFSNAPLILLGHREEQAELIAALESGADDFAYLPCSRSELEARLWALLRRTGYGAFRHGDPAGIC